MREKPYAEKAPMSAMMTIAGITAVGASPNAAMPREG
jgi:hypothetical protein